MSNRQLRNYVRECVDHYATISKLDDFYSLLVTDLPSFVQDEFAAMIMVEDESYAAEATGPDNKHWESKMLPALTRYLKNSTDKDESIEFNNVWRDCVTSYFHNHMQELIDELCLDKTHSDYSGLYSRHRRTGEDYWSQHP